MPESSPTTESRSLFEHHVIDSAPSGGAECCTDVLAVGDINGDGYEDVVIGAEKAKGAGLVWYEFPSWTRHEIAAGNFTTDAKLIDVDSDGDLDIVIGNTDIGLMLYEHASGDRWIPRKLSDGYAHDVLAVDLDGNGVIDVVTTDKKRVKHLEIGESNVSSVDVLIERPGEGLSAADIDEDGDLDILYSNLWLEQQRDSTGIHWLPHEIDATWDPDTRVQTADVNGDGRLDIVLSGSEGQSPLAWFERSDDGASWTKHAIGGEVFTGAHSLQLADFDMDGDVDVLVAEMNTAATKRVVLYLQQAGEWRALPLASYGSHNMMASDMDGDGDIDAVGKNYQGIGRFIEYWENRSADLKQVPTAKSDSSWSYQPIDTARPASDRHTMGLFGADVNADGLVDVVAGGSLYLRPSEVAAQWKRIAAAPGFDIIHVMPQHQSGWSRLLAVGPTSLELVSAEDRQGEHWSHRTLHSLPPGRSQGHATSTPDAQGNFSLYFTRGTTLFRMLISSTPTANQWRLVRVRESVQEEGVAVGDLDGDGDEDVVLVDGDGHRLIWLETDGDRSRRAHSVGASLHWIDRVAIADLNGDGRNDLIFTEETRDHDYNARAVWLEAPTQPRSGRWTPHVVAVLRSINSLGVVDADHNGAMDLVIAEHTDLRPDSRVTDNFTGLLLNRGDGTFVTEVVEIGTHSSHLGALPIGPDSEGRFEIASVGWEQSCCIHRWVKAATHVTGKNSN